MTLAPRNNREGLLDALAAGKSLSYLHPEATDPARWRGLNLLGFALMETRSRLAEHTS